MILLKLDVFVQIVVCLMAENLLMSDELSLLNSGLRELH